MFKENVLFNCHCYYSTGSNDHFMFMSNEIFFSPEWYVDFSNEYVTTFDRDFSLGKYSMIEIAFNVCGNAYTLTIV